MYPYNPHSQKAEEFINHEEILETLAYAEENKHNIPLIDSIIEKAKVRKGLSHREAMVLLDCDIPEKNEEIYALAKRLQDLRQPYCDVCAAVSFQLLRQRLCILSVPCEK